MSEEPDSKSPEDDPHFTGDSYGPGSNPAGAATQVVTYTYDRRDRLAAPCDLRGEITCYEIDPLELLIKTFGGQMVKSIAGKSGYSSTPNPAWTFSGLAAEGPLAYDIYVFSATPLDGREWPNDYAVSIGTLALSGEPADWEFGAMWYKLGSVTVPACTSALTVNYQGKLAAAGVVWLVKKDAVQDVE